jgi:drug/metabolite transporter (DMT)-like permease
MIWVRKVPQQVVARRGLSRAFSWLLFQTCFFGVAIFAVLMISAGIHPTPAWLPLMLIIALTGFAGGIVGAFIAFGMLSAQGPAEE